MPFFSHVVSWYGAVVTVGIGPSVLSIWLIGIFDQMCAGRIGTASLARNSASRVERCITNVFASGAETDLSAGTPPTSWLVLFFRSALNVQSASALVNSLPSDQWMLLRRWNVIVLPSGETSTPFASALW